jgi:hypothetical protein
MAVFSVILSSIVAGIVAITLFTSQSYKSGRSVSLACLAMGVLICPTVGLFPPVGVTAFGLAILCGFLARGGQPTPRRIAIVSTVGFAVGMAAGALFSLPYVRDLRALRDKYPFVSVASRLDYETKGNEPTSVSEGLRVEEHTRAATGDADSTASSAAARFGPPPLGSPAWVALNPIDERRRDWSRRRHALELIHASAVEQFANAPGFGIARMSYLSDYDLMDRRQPPVKLRGTGDQSPSPGQPDPLRDAPLSVARPGTTPSSFERLWDIHNGGLRDFFDPEDEGLVLDRDHVAGFVPHRFSQDFPPPPPAGRLKWELCRLELVSLRRFGRPMVYATNGKLPQMDQLPNVPTRELNAFEGGALEALVKGEELAYAQKEKNVLALGALRARDTCTKCHEVQRGALLGAFSYEFLGNATPAGDAPPTKPPI